MASKFDAREFLLRAGVGIVFVLVLSAPAVWALRERDPGHLQRVVVYVAIALVAGIAFGAATVSRGEIRWTRLGISLGGGAAVGIATLVVVHRLLPPPSPLVLLQPTTRGHALLEVPRPDVRVRRLENSQEFLVEILRPGVEHLVSFVVVEGGDGQVRRAFRIADDGRVSPEEDAR